MEGRCTTPSPAIEVCSEVVAAASGALENSCVGASGARELVAGLPRGSGCLVAADAAEGKLEELVLACSPRWCESLALTLRDWSSVACVEWDRFPLVANQTPV